MFTVAYLANQFPVAVEPYVGEEIAELRRLGVKVIAGSVRPPNARPETSNSTHDEAEILSLQPLRLLILLHALALALRRWKKIVALIARMLVRGKESPKQRLKALLHTYLGAYYAVQLRERGVDHIHVHHGYFGSWIGMVAGILLDVPYSLTLHGSDLLIDGVYLDAKLRYCSFCSTISAYNRRYILEHFPAIEPKKIRVARLGVEIPERSKSPPSLLLGEHNFTLLAVGRLHAVKDHAFLLRACVRLRDLGLKFECLIAGEGPERQSLELLTRENRLQDRIQLLGHVTPARMDALYRQADVVVLTSRSEGIPLVLMEAMVRCRIVLAPSITGIPEIVIPGKTGFLYAPAVLDDFVTRILFLNELMLSGDRNAVSRLDWIRHAASAQVLHNFNRDKSLSRFGEHFLQQLAIH